MKTKEKSKSPTSEGTGMTRNKFLSTGLTAAAALAMMPAYMIEVKGKTLPNDNLNINSKDKERGIIFGWTTCLTYETNDRKLGYEYFSHLLDEMHSHGMSRLLVMMASHGYFSPQNHGLAWPVKNEKLRFQIDKQALNAFEETEFFSKIIEKAHSLNIEVYIEIKYLGMIGIKEGYPGVDFHRKKDGRLTSTIRPEASDYEREAIETLSICCDNSQAHQYMRDKISDVLTRYIKLDGIVLEHPSYSSETCYCPGTRQLVKKETGKDIDELSFEEFKKWKGMRIRDTLLDLKNIIKSINPNFKFGFYTGFSPTDGNITRFQLNRGHDPELLKQVGFDFLMPYSEGRHKEQELEENQKIIDYLTPMDIYLHTVIRKVPPHNYQLPSIGPEYIKSIIKWGKKYSKINKRFRGMTFFNEVKIPDENRQAVYDSI